MKKNKILLFLSIIVILFLSAYYFLRTEPKLVITTDKSDYYMNGILRVNIENKTSETICFSSCYPYLLEKKVGDWRSYEYAECRKNNLTEKCIQSKDEKAFELVLKNTERNFHRLAIPVCIGCSANDVFREVKRFYSNEFIVE